MAALQAQPRRPEILVVEDSEGLAHVVARSIRRCAARPRVVGTIAGAKEAVDDFELHGAVIDLDLPDGCGTEILGALRSRFDNIPILVQTGLRDPLRLNAAHAHRAHLVLKPALGPHIELLVDDAFWHRWMGHGALASAVSDVASELSLTRREREVLALAVRGHSQFAIGATLGIAISSVRSHCGSLRRKAGKRRLAEVVASVTERLVRSPAS